MARRRRSSNLLTDVARLPWQAGVAIAAIAWVALRYVLPAVLVRSDSVVLSRLDSVPHDVAPIVAGLFLIAAGVSWWRASYRRRLLDSRTDLASVRSLPWERFEHLVGEAYRRQGYAVEENASKGADGGVDLVLTKDGERVLVQCKRWDKPVGVPTVRELLGAVTAAGAARGILVTSGRFTTPAETFARTNGIELVDGHALERLVRSVRGTATEPAKDVALVASAPSTTPGPPGASRTSGPDPSCPLCRAPMTWRKARRGSHAGSTFLGCSRFPACRGTRPAA